MARRAYRVARPVRPNAGLRDAYFKKLADQIKSFEKTVIAPALQSYEPINFPAQAHDAVKKDNHDDIILSLRERYAKWAKKEDEQINLLARWFTDSNFNSTSSAFKHSLAQSLGHTVKLNLSPALKELLKKVAHDNVGLIKSIHTVYASKVQALVLDSVHKGRNLQSLTESLTDRFNVSLSQAKLIAYDQNNKVTSAIERQRRLDIGIKEARWLHSGGGKTPRPDHLAAHNRIYDVLKGCLISGKYIHPGEEIRCGCVSAAVIPNFSDWNPVRDVGVYA